MRGVVARTGTERGGERIERADGVADEAVVLDEVDRGRTVLGAQPAEPAVELAQRPRDERKRSTSIATTPAAPVTSMASIFWPITKSSSSPSVCTYICDRPALTLYSGGCAM